MLYLNRYLFVHVSCIQCKLLKSRMFPMSQPYTPISSQSIALHLKSFCPVFTHPLLCPANSQNKIKHPLYIIRYENTINFKVKLPLKKLQYSVCFVLAFHHSCTEHSCGHNVISVCLCFVTWNQRLNQTSSGSSNRPLEKFHQRGCCISSLLVTKRFEVALLHEYITQLEQKNSSHWYTCDLSPHRVSAMQVHYF